MKKITLFVMVLLCFIWQGSAQFVESFETEIPATWTILDEASSETWVWDNTPSGSGGAQDGSAVARISFDGSTAHDDYLVTPSITVAAGVNDRISFWVQSRSGTFLESYDVRLSTATATAADFTVILQAETTAPTTWTQLTFDLTPYVGQTVYVAIRATGLDEFELYADNFVNDTAPTDTLDFFNLQFPATGNIEIGDEFLVFAQAYEAGLTDGSDTPAAGIEAWIGYSTVDSSPDTDSDWTWVAASTNPGFDFTQNNDEYFLDLGAEVPIGTYYYASRWRLNGGPFTYGGILPDGSNGGEWGVGGFDSGVLTVTAPPAPGNDECDNAVALTVNSDFACATVTAGTTVSATASAQTDDVTGTPNNDVWFTFVATNASHRVSLLNVSAVIGSATDMGMGVYDLTGGCGTLVFVDDSDPNTLDLSGLNIGTTYTIRVYGWADSSSAQATFDICVGTPPIGDDCSNPIVAGALPYNDSDDTANYNDIYSGGPGTGCGTTNNYLNGNDVVYSYTATSDTSINISLTSIGSTYAGVFAYDNCADIGTQCAVEGDFNGSSTADLEFDMPVVNGETYYFVISTWASPQSTSYTLDITENTCTDATVNYMVVNDCAVSGGFNIEVEITDMGSATDITLSDDQGSSTQAVTTTGTYTFGPYVNATDVVITVTDDNDSNCIQNSGALTQAACPPDNVDCGTAEVVTVGINAPGPTVNGTNVGAGDSGVADPSCNAFYVTDDIWYSFTTPADIDELTIDIASSGFSSTIAVLYDNCIDLNEVACNQQFVSAPTIVFSGLAANTNYILRLYDFSGDDAGPISFDISASTTLGIDGVDPAAFTYYPNPVKNTLTLNAQNTIEHVTMYNMLGQEVLRATPNTVDSHIDMSGLQTGTYFVKVTIANSTKTIRVIKQ